MLLNTFTTCAGQVADYDPGRQEGDRDQQAGVVPVDERAHRSGPGPQLAGEPAPQDRADDGDPEESRDLARGVEQRGGDAGLGLRGGLHDRVGERRVHQPGPGAEQDDPGQQVVVADLRVEPVEQDHPDDHEQHPERHGAVRPGPLLDLGRDGRGHGDAPRHRHEDEPGLGR
jgi:hypothetical protein